MLLRISYLKLVRPNQSNFSPGSAVTTTLQSDNIEIAPLGGSTTAAPSTLFFDRASKFQYYSAVPYSTAHAALTAATSTNDRVIIV